MLGKTFQTFSDCFLLNELVTYIHVNDGIYTVWPYKKEITILNYFYLKITNKIKGKQVHLYLSQQSTHVKSETLGGCLPVKFGIIINDIFILFVYYLFYIAYDSVQRYRHKPETSHFFLKIECFKSYSEAVTPSSVPNSLPKPSERSIRKKMMDQKGAEDPNSLTASVKTMKARPVPWAAYNDKKYMPLLTYLVRKKKNCCLYKIMHSLILRRKLNHQL